jgi:hypothetical protein
MCKRLRHGNRVDRTFRVTRRRLGILAAWAAAAAGIAGCTVPGGKSTAVESAAPGTTVQRLVYRTESDRLNVLAGGTAVAGLPPVTISVLEIRSPHPHGMPEHAQAVLMCVPADADSPTGPAALWQWLVGGDGAEASRSPPANAAERVQAWVIDLPQEQFDRLLSRLREKNFYQRARSFRAQAYVATETGGRRFGREFEELPELDALIVRVHREGRLVAPAPDLRGLVAPGPTLSSAATGPPAMETESHRITLLPPVDGTR